MGEQCIEQPLEFDQLRRDIALKVFRSEGFQNLIKAAAQQIAEKRLAGIDFEYLESAEPHSSNRQ